MKYSGPKGGLTKLYIKQNTCIEQYIERKKSIRCVRKGNIKRDRTREEVEAGKIHRQISRHSVRHMKSNSHTCRERERGRGGRERTEKGER